MQNLAQPKQRPQTIQNNNSPITLRGPEPEGLYHGREGTSLEKNRGAGNRLTIISARPQAHSQVTPGSFPSSFSGSFPVIPRLIPRLSPVSFPVIPRLIPSYPQAHSQVIPQAHSQLSPGSFPVIPSLIPSYPQAHSPSSFLISSPR